MVCLLGKVQAKRCQGGDSRSISSSVGSAPEPVDRNRHRVVELQLLWHTVTISNKELHSIIRQLKSALEEERAEARDREARLIKKI